MGAGPSDAPGPAFVTIGWMDTECARNKVPIKIGDSPGLH